MARRDCEVCWPWPFQPGALSQDTYPVRLSEAGMYQDRCLHTPINSIVVGGAGIKASPDLGKERKEADEGQRVELHFDSKE